MDVPTRECDGPIPSNQQSEEPENGNLTVTRASSKCTATMLKFLSRDSSNAKVLLNLSRKSEYVKSTEMKAVVSKIGMEDGRSPLVKKLQPFGSVPLTRNEKRTILQNEIDWTKKNNHCYLGKKGEHSLLSVAPGVANGILS